MTEEQWNFNDHVVRELARSARQMRDSAQQAIMRCGAADQADFKALGWRAPTGILRDLRRIDRESTELQRHITGTITVQQGIVLARQYGLHCLADFLWVEENVEESARKTLVNSGLFGPKGVV